MGWPVGLPGPGAAGYGAPAGRRIHHELELRATQKRRRARGV